MVVDIEELITLIDDLYVRALDEVYGVSTN